MYCRERNRGDVEAQDDVRVVASNWLPVYEAADVHAIASKRTILSAIFYTRFILVQPGRAGFSR